MPFFVRRANSEDAARLGSFAADLFRDAYGPTHPEPTLSQYLSASFSTDALRARVADSTRTFLLAENESADWLGYAELRVGLPDLKRVTIARALPTERALEIVRFYVAPSHHGQGVAQALMRAAEHLAVESGAGVLWLQAWQEAAQALRFYEKVGFEIYGTAIFEFGERVDHDYLLAKPVRAGGSLRQAAG